MLWCLVCNGRSRAVVRFASDCGFRRFGNVFSALIMFFAARVAKNHGRHIINGVTVDVVGQGLCSCSMYVQSLDRQQYRHTWFFRGESCHHASSSVGASVSLARSNAKHRHFVAFIAYVSSVVGASVSLARTS